MVWKYVSRPDGLLVASLKLQTANSGSSTSGILFTGSQTISERRLHLWPWLKLFQTMSEKAI